MNSNHKFTVGKYKTRNGRDAVVLMDDATGTYPLVGYVVWPDGKKEMHTWRDDGMFNGRPGDRADLMPPAKLRPWRPEEVPLGAWVKDKRAERSRWLILAVSEYGITTANASFAGPRWRTFDNMESNCLFSVDNGATWQPCGVEE
jgi:hypothetical protein